MTNITKISYFRLLIFILALQITNNIALAEPLKVAVLKFGTVNWELNVIKEHGLDKKRNIDIKVIPLTNKDATTIALLSNEADIIVTDWIWVSRQREAGEDFTLVPYSTSSGAIMVPNKSSITSLEDLKGTQMGVAGGAIDKSWLLIRAYSIKTTGKDLNKMLEPAYAAPPLLNAMMLKGDFSAVLNYWNYTARLKAKGYKKLIGVNDVLKELGINGPLPLIGYVFRESYVQSNPNKIKSFIEASWEAREILKSSNLEWDRIVKLTGAKDKATLAALRDEFRNGIPDKNTEEMKLSISKAYEILADIGGKKLVGNNTKLSPGTIWSLN